MLCAASDEGGSSVSSLQCDLPEDLAPTFLACFEECQAKINNFGAP